MKKTLIALALTALPVASMADVILYGQIKGGVEVVKQKNVNGTTTQIVDYGSRIGFKGHEQLNGDLQAIWQLEQAVNIGGSSTGFGTRDSFIGLKSNNAGTVKVGYQQTPVAELNDKLDIWEASDANVVGGLKTFTRSNDAANRKVAITYETPNFNGFSAKGFVSTGENYNGTDSNGNVTSTSGGETAGNRKGRDMTTYGLSASYVNSGFFADAAGVYVKNGANNDTNLKNGTETLRKRKSAYQVLGQAGYDNGTWLVGAAYQYARHVDPQPTTVSTQFNTNWDVSNEVALTGAYRIDNALRLKASAAYGFNIKDNAGDKFLGNGKYIQGIVGADYALSKRTQVNGQFGYLTAGSKENKVRTGLVGVGMKHSF